MCEMYFQNNLCSMHSGNESHELETISWDSYTNKVVA